MRYKMAKHTSTNARNQIDGWFNCPAAKNAETQGYENQEHSSRLLGQTYLIAGVVRPAVQNPIVTPAPVVQNTPVHSQPPVILRGTSEADPIDVLDRNDELFVDLNQTPDQEERVRRRFERIRSESSSSSSQ